MFDGNFSVLKMVFGAKEVLTFVECMSGGCCVCSIRFWFEYFCSFCFQVFSTANSCFGKTEEKERKKRTKKEQWWDQFTVIESSAQAILWVY